MIALTDELLDWYFMTIGWFNWLGFLHDCLVDWFISHQFNWLLDWTNDMLRCCLQIMRIHKIKVLPRSWRLQSSTTFRSDSNLISSLLLSVSQNGQSMHCLLSISLPVWAANLFICKNDHLFYPSHWAPVCMVISICLFVWSDWLPVYLTYWACKMVCYLSDWAPVSLSFCYLSLVITYPIACQNGLL